MVRCVPTPVLAGRDVPFDASLVLSAGVCKYHGRYVMVFRNDAGFSPDGNWGKTWTNLGIAYSNDGVKWEVNSKPWKAAADLVASDPEILRVYDPRLTVIDGRCYLCFAVDTRHGVRGGNAIYALRQRLWKPRRGRPGSRVKSKKTIETSNKPVYRGNCRCAIIGFLVTCPDFTGCP